MAAQPGFVLSSLSRLIFAMVLGLSASAHAQSPQAPSRPNLSDQLPIELVRELIADRLWRSEFDEIGNPLALELSNFVAMVSDSQVSASQVTQSLFGQALGEELPRPSLYSVKFKILRHLSKLPSRVSDERARTLQNEWKNQYVQVALALIRSIRHPELTDMAQRMEVRVANGSLSLFDLSPQARETLSQTITASHGESLTQKRKNVYVVSGFFNPAANQLALDFSLPLQQTLITFIHEMVHATDPVVEAHRAVYDELLPRSLDILGRWMSTETAADAIRLDNQSHIRKESDLKAMGDQVRKLRQSIRERLEEESRNFKKDEAYKLLYKPQTEDLALLRRWVRAGLGLTLENEYRAYGLSLVAYAALKTKHGLIPPDPRRQRFLDAFIAGDEEFVLQLSTHLPNPALRVSTQLFQSATQSPEPHELGKTDPALNFLRKQNAMRALHEIHSMLLDESETFIRELNNKFATEIRALDSQGRVPSPLPDWAQPGQFDLPSNPFQLLTARITTATALLFRSNFEQLLQELKDIAEPLTTMRAGVLDLHDISFGELQLLGVHYRSSRFQSLPRELEESLKADWAEIPVSVSGQFSIPEFQSTKSAQPDPIRGEEVLSKLLNLRLIKAGLWVDQAIPRLRGSVQGSRVYLERLQTGDYLKQPSELEHDDAVDSIQPERRNQLIRELLSGLQEVSSFYSELEKAEELFKQLRTLEVIAEEFKLTQPQERESIDTTLQLFQSKANSVKLFLNNSRVSKAGGPATDEISKILSDFDKQLQGRRRICQERRFRDPLEMQLFAGDGPFQMGSFRFRTMSLCQNRQLYMVRMPGDFTGFMTSYVGPAQACPAQTRKQCESTPDCQWTDGQCFQAPRPWSRIFNGSRPVILSPVPPTLTRKATTP